MMAEFADTIRFHFTPLDDATTNAEDITAR
jgi:hypothetical protein